MRTESLDRCCGESLAYPRVYHQTKRRQERTSRDAKDLRLLDLQTKDYCQVIPELIFITDKI